MSFKQQGRMINGASSANGRHAAACSRGRRSNRAAGYTSRPLTQKRELRMLGFSCYCLLKDNSRTAVTSSAFGQDDCCGFLNEGRARRSASQRLLSADGLICSIIQPSIWWIIKVIFGGGNDQNMFQPLQWEDFLPSLLCFYIIVNSISLSFGLFLGRKKASQSQSSSTWLWLVLTAFLWHFIDQTITLHNQKSNHQIRSERKVVSCSPTFFFRHFKSKLLAFWKMLLCNSHAPKCLNRFQTQTNL